MPTLSLSIIVKNEEKNLPRLLTSVAGVFDQIALTDTGSTDKTIEIAKSFGAEIYHFQWIDDFAAARNFAFSQCRGDYIMWLDADDEILPEDKALILQLKPNLHLADAWLSRYNYAQDEYDRCTISLHRHRIVKNFPPPRWKWPIHECMEISPTWKQGPTPITVTHRRSGDDYVKDLGRNLRMLKQAVAHEPNEPRLLFYYAKELFSNEQIKECIPVFESYLAKGEGWHDDRVNAHYLLAVSYWRLGNEDEAINICLKGIKLDPRWAEFYTTIGQIHYNNGRWRETIPWFEMAGKLPMLEAWGTVIPDNYTWIPHDRLCKAYSQVGKIREAYDANEKALSYRPNDPRLLFNREFLKDHLHPSRKADRPLRLSLGSGGKPTQSYLCTDKFQAPNVVELIDQMDLPYFPATVHAIYSEHALEHSDGHIAAEKAVEEWARVLRHGGHLWLKVPDLDMCCEQFVLAEDRERLPNERWTPKEWYRYTIYGIQVSQNGEPDQGQYHRTGFTKPSLRRLLEKHGFEIRTITNYDGWGTPSIEVQAVQIKQPLKVAWMIPGTPDYNHGSLRIRRLNVHWWLTQNGVDSKILDYTKPDELEKAHYADVCIFISFGQIERDLIDKLKRRGVKCVMDHCEDLSDLPGQNECFQAVDLVACCSTVLTENSMKYGRVIMVPDACEELSWNS